MEPDTFNIIIEALQAHGATDVELLTSQTTQEIESLTFRYQGMIHEVTAEDEMSVHTCFLKANVYGKAAG